MKCAVQHSCGLVAVNNVRRWQGQPAINRESPRTSLSNAEISTLLGTHPQAVSYQQFKKLMLEGCAAVFHTPVAINEYRTWFCPGFANADYIGVNLFNDREFSLIKRQHMRVLVEGSQLWVVRKCA